MTELIDIYINGTILLSEFQLINEETREIENHH